MDASSWQAKEDVSTTLRPLEGEDAPGLLIISSLNGYTEPCGCTEEIVYGGIDRLVGTTIGLRKSQKQPLLAVSAGDTFFDSITADSTQENQDGLRIALLERGLKDMGLTVMGVGPYDLTRGWQTFNDAATHIGATIVSTNLHPSNPEDDETTAWQPSLIRTVGNVHVAFLNIVLPDAFDALPVDESLRLLDPSQSLTTELAQPSVQRADLRVLFIHGTQESSADFVARTSGIDIVVTTQHDTPRDSIGSWGSASQLQLWSQGRELGVLRLVKGESEETPTWQQTGNLSRDEFDNLTQMITRLGEQIQELEDRLAEGERSPMLAKLRLRRAEYQLALNRAQEDHNEEKAPQDAQFLWDVIQLARGTPQDSAIRDARVQYNQALRAENLKTASPPKAAPDDQPHYVGAASCKGCHIAAHMAWEDTAHAHAYASLTTVDKAFDLRCIGCHVTGYQEPGGSTLGFTDSLENVQCEACHGPGSEHVQAPTTAHHERGIHRNVPVSTCQRCHTPEHSPQFDDAVYRARILVPGHGQAVDP